MIKQEQKVKLLDQTKPAGQSSLEDGFHVLDVNNVEDRSGGIQVGWVDNWGERDALRFPPSHHSGSLWAVTKYPDKEYWQQIGPLAMKDSWK